MNFRQFAFNNVFRNKRTYAAYFLSSSFSVMIFFIYSVIASHPAMKDGISHMLPILAMGIAKWIVYVFSFFFILYSVGAFLKARQHEFGVLMIHGMSPRQLNRLIFLENMIIGFGAIVTGIGSGLLLAKVGFVIGGSAIGIELPYHISMSALVMTAGSFVVLFFVISFLTQFMVSKSKVQQLLQGTNKPKPEPKASLLLSLLAVLLLVASYVLSYMATAGTIGYLMLPVVLMTIIGSYFLFTQLSVFLVHLLKRNDRLFLYKTNMLTISDLAYRMKDNARMFFMVCIVSTVAFCAVGTLASFAVIEDELVQSHVYDLNYVSKQGNQMEQTHLTEIESLLKMKGIEYRKNDYEYLTVKPKEGRAQWTVFAESVYNKAAGDLRRPSVSVTDEQALLIPYLKDSVQFKLPFESETVHVANHSIKLTTTDKVEGPITNQGLIGDALIVSDEMYKKLSEHAKKGVIYGYKTIDWEQTVGVGAGIEQDYNNAIKANGSKSREITFEFSSLATSVAVQRQMFSIMMFSALLVGAVFFIASGSFLYFRLYTDLEQDKERYKAIGKIGLTDRELSKIATTQLLLLFFIPIIVAVVHSAFAFTALQSIINLSIVGQTVKVLAGFTIAQVIYFFVIRWRYMIHLREAVR
ncbi:ABC transporter permease [Paenibacillus sp. SC116]|uniref:FtsX-like permease family protein n=1 Tax=Paenibacillus sp. SC116 TaxID=2968986 RepID=UPI00215A2667|nr:ABC transporter permease [Paenibacillus sp. SC116]MCR8844019.1 ABC transporter permease [Paenibacillus sp. SC116]